MMATYLYLTSVFMEWVMAHLVMMAVDCVAPGPT